MIFNSITFLIFLMISVCLFWVLNLRARLLYLFLASLVFYAFWRVEFLAVMLFSTVLDYVVSLELGKVRYTQKQRKGLLLVSILLNLGVLFFFKYLLFFTDSIISLAHVFGLEWNSPALNIILPLGISFYTFQTMSYTIDVYRRHRKPVRDFTLYACYVTFFPQLVAGPILRASEVVDQLSVGKKFDMRMLQEGLKRILYGLFLKVVLADNIAPLVNDGFAIEAAQFGGLDVWTLAFLFGFQIYFDFAGYSHIAIGCARLMGINFPENFNFPYAARSFRDFWKRWHISLSSWIRDYLYLPLTGARVVSKLSSSEGGLGQELNTTGKKRSKDAALFLTWGIMGLWHGANWTFVFWGLYHSTMIYAERQLQKLWTRLNIKWNAKIGWLVTLSLAMLGWIPFRAQTLNDALIMFGKAFNPFTYLQLTMRENVYLITALIAIAVILTYEVDHIGRKLKSENSLAFIPLHVVKYTAIVLLVYIFFRPINQFIYFQF